MLLVDKYSPKSLRDWIGDPSIKTQVQGYFTNFIYSTPIMKLLLLDGSPGNGKTSIVYAIANDMNLNVIEVNASDHRNKADIKTLKGLAYLHNEKQNVILIDEADGLRSWKYIMDFLKNPPCPVILTCNNISKIDYKVIKLCLPITINYPPRFVVSEHLKHISISEGCDISDTNIDTIAKLCTNVRSAIYTLQQWSMGKMDKIEALDTQFTIEDKMGKLFKGESVYLTNTEHYEIIKWGIANHLKIGQLSQLSILQSLGKRVAGMQDLIRDFGYTIRGSIGKYVIRKPIPRWKRRWKKDKKFIKKLDSNNKKLSKLSRQESRQHVGKETNEKLTEISRKNNEPEIDINEKLKIKSTGRNLEELF